MNLFIFKMQLKFKGIIRDLKNLNILPDQKFFNNFARPVINPHPLWLFLLYPLFVSTIYLTFGFVFLLKTIGSIYTALRNMFIHPKKSFENLAMAIIHTGFSLFSFIMSPISILIYSAHVASCIINTGGRPLSYFPMPLQDYVDDIPQTEEEEEEYILILYNLWQRQQANRVTQPSYIRHVEQTLPQINLNYRFFKPNDDTPAPDIIGPLAIGERHAHGINTSK